MTYTPQWLAQLQPASWGGHTFGVNSSSFSSGRRVVTHSYPYKDVPWIEDLGRETQQVQFRGFLVGENCYTLRDQMMAACNRAGQGTLVHPSLGKQKAFLISASFSESKEMGRVVEIDLQFVIAGELSTRLYPISSALSQSMSLVGATALGEAASTDFFGQVGQAVQQGATVVQDVVHTANVYANIVLQPLKDAARLVNMVGGMSTLLDPGHSYGRYINGNVGFAPKVLNTINSSLGMVARTEAGVNAVIGSAVTLRSSVENAAGLFTNLAGAL